MTSTSSDSRMRRKLVGFGLRMLVISLAVIGVFATSLYHVQKSEAISLQQSIEPTPFPTDPDPVGDARSAADSFLKTAHLGVPSIVIPPLRQYLGSGDLYIRYRAAMVVLRIVSNEASVSSELRAAVRADTGIQNALFAASAHDASGEYGHRARHTSIAALAAVMPIPNAEVESVLAEQYWTEFSPEGRYLIVEVLGGRMSASQSALDVYEDAAADRFDSEIARLAQGILDSMNTW